MDITTVVNRAGFRDNAPAVASFGSRFPLPICDASTTTGLAIRHELGPHDTQRQFSRLSHPLTRSLSLSRRARAPLLPH